MNKESKIGVIGAGVSGLSCALLLHRNGWDVTIISKHDPNKKISDPKFSSLVPAASIIPHSVTSNILSELFSESKAYFKKLFRKEFPGVKQHEHFELFTDERNLPEYAELMDELSLFESFKNQFYPKHPELKARSGWKFLCYFTDWNLYYPALLNEVRSAGIKLKLKELHQSDIRELPFDIIVNCSELGAIELFNDPHSLIYRGHILQIPGAPPLTNPNGKTVSYNFFPGRSAYQSSMGHGQDVYCYPRTDGWVFGGSRQKGTMTDRGTWNIEKTSHPYQIVQNLKVPEQIFRLNKEIIQHSFGVDAGQFSPIKPKMAYRYIRKQQQGLRLEKEELENKLIVHNYGHGGAGVTLSWGCASKVIELLDEV